MILLALAVLAAWWTYDRSSEKGGPKILGEKNYAGHKQQLAISRKPMKLYDLTGRDTYDRRRAVGLPPFSGQSKNMNPRVPPPFTAPIPKLAHRIDWKSPTASSMFRDPVFRQNYKRMHQMVYGTPTTFARRGQLQADWGPAEGNNKGYPIQRGRTQSWLPGLFPDAMTGVNAYELPLAPSKEIANHTDLGSYLKDHTRSVNLHSEFAPSSKRIVW